MSQSSLEITDKDGWRIEYPLNKIITYIGSDAQNDIVLETWHGTGVAARHVQLISLAAEGQGFRLVNLGDTDIRLGESGDRAALPRTFIQLMDGERIRLGDFMLIFHVGEFAASAAAGGAAAANVALPRSVGAEATASKTIGLRLSLPGTRVSPDQPIEGAVYVTNLGNKPGVQFKLAVEGLEPDCYEMGPGPVLFPGAEKATVFRLRHSRKPKPPAGEQRFSIRATASDAYPGESAVVSQVVQIQPFYGHKLRLVS